MGYDYTVIQVVCWVELLEQRRLCLIFVKIWISINGTQQCGIGPLGYGVSQLGIRAWVNDYLGSSNVGIHKYGPDTSSSQLGIKKLGTQVPRVDGHGFRSCIIVCCVFCA